MTIHIYSGRSQKTESMPVGKTEVGDIYPSASLLPDESGPKAIRLGHSQEGTHAMGRGTIETRIRVWSSSQVEGAMHE